MEDNNRYIRKLKTNKIKTMKKVTILTALISLLAISCVEESECYKCELISKDGRFSRTEYLMCDTDIEQYKDWLYDIGKVGIIKCTEL